MRKKVSYMDDIRGFNFWTTSFLTVISMFATLCLPWSALQELYT